MCVPTCRETRVILATIIIAYKFIPMQKLCLFDLSGHVGRNLHKSEDSLTQFSFKIQSLQGH